MAVDLNQLEITVAQLEQDATVIGKIVNDPADEPNAGQEDGTVTTRLGDVVKNVNRVLDEVSAKEPVANLNNNTTTDLAEGSNLYYTNERVDDQVNTLLTAGTNITLTYDDGAGTLTIDAEGGGSSKGIAYSEENVTVDPVNGVPNAGEIGDGAAFDTLYSVIDYINNSYEYLESLRITFEGGVDFQSIYTPNFFRPVDIPACAQTVTLRSATGTFTRLNFLTRDLSYASHQAVFFENLYVDFGDSITTYTGGMTDCQVTMASNTEWTVRRGTQETGVTGFEFNNTPIGHGGSGLRIMRIQGGDVTWNGQSGIFVDGIDVTDPSESFILVDQDGSMTLNGVVGDFFLSDSNFGIGTVIVRDGGTFINNRVETEANTANGDFGPPFSTANVQIENSARLSAGMLRQFIPLSTTLTPFNAHKYNESSSAGAVTLTVNSGAGFQAGDEIYIEQTGAGTITFAAGAGVTINSRDAALSTAGQYATAFLKFKSATEATLSGDIA